MSQSVLAHDVTGVTVQADKSQYRLNDTVNITGTTYNQTSYVSNADVNT